MFVFEFEAGLSKSEFYAQVADSLRHLIEGERNWVTNYANASSLLHHAMISLDYFIENPILWVGFYMKDPSKPSWLSLGPFQGKVACTRIKFGRGVCGTAAASGVSQVIENVHEFPGHIACDAASNSEIVIPIFNGSSSLRSVPGIETEAETETGTGEECNVEVIGVLDIDSTAFGTFDEVDREGLENYVRILAEGSDF